MAIVMDLIDDESGELRDDHDTNASPLKIKKRALSCVWAWQSSKDGELEH
jgi:hypothetical protein